MKTRPPRPETMVNYTTIPASIAGQVYEPSPSVPSTTLSNSFGGDAILISPQAVIIQPEVIHTDSL